MRKAKVLIAKGILEPAKELAQYLNQWNDIEVIDVIDDGNKVCDIINHAEVDILVLDLVLHKKDGFEVLENLSYLNKKPKCIVLTSVDTQKAINKAMLLGADIYLLDSIEHFYLLKRIRELMEEDDELSPSRIKNREEMLTSLMHRLGLYANLKGYNYIKDGVNFILEDKEVLQSFTKKLYPLIAEKNNAVVTSVEKAIRHSINTFWDNGGNENFNKIFHYSKERKKPTSSELIKLIYEYIERNAQ